MKRNITQLLVIMMASVLMFGCSNMNTAKMADSNEHLLSADGKILISEGNIPGSPHKDISYIDLTVTKSDVQGDLSTTNVNEVLAARARKYGANGVINVTYTKGVNILYGEYVKVSGLGVKITDQE